MTEIIPELELRPTSLPFFLFPPWFTAFIIKKTIALKNILKETMSVQDSIAVESHKKTK